MRLIPNNFFAGGDTLVFCYLDLNDFYCKHWKEISPTNNPQPEQIQRALFRYDRRDWTTYGGYGEDRRNIWDKTYLKETKQFIHLGVDIQMPKGTEVIAPFDAQLIDV